MLCNPFVVIFVAVFREKEEELKKLQTKQKEHAKETEAVIEEFKKQTADKSTKIFQDLNNQVFLVPQCIFARSTGMLNVKTIIIGYLHTFCPFFFLGIFHHC